VKRVLHLIKGLGRGGAEMLLVSASPYFDRERFHYEVAYLLPWKDAVVGDIRSAGLPVHCLDGGRGAGWLRRLRSLVQEREVDLVHSHSPFAAVGARTMLGRAVKHVHTEHNVWTSYHRATYWANLLTFPRNEHVFAVSEHVRVSIRYPSPLRFLRMPPRETLYHGLDPVAFARWGSPDGVREELGLAADAPVMGIVANFRPQKGHHDLFRATAEVRKVLPDVRLVVVGQGPLEQQLRDHVNALGLEDTVLFTGQRDDVPRLVSAFDLFVLPSLFEGLAIALVEALALGKPAVVTQVGGLVEVVQHGKHGLVVQPGDHRGLAGAIVRLLQDPDLRRRLGEEGRRRAADFDIRRAVGRVEQVYQEVLA
jgi:glycosyltransferase involved in cell wall biosynthesis